MLRALLLICILASTSLLCAMSSHEAARLANRAYLNHRQALIDQLGSADQEERLRAMRHLAQLHDASAIPHLVPFLDELANKPADMVGAIRALAVLGSQESGTTFTQLLNHPDRNVVKACYNALAHLEQLKGTHHIDLSGDEQDGLRATGVIGLALSDADKTEAGKILAAALSDDSDAHIRRMAAIGLGDLGMKEHVDDLIEGLADSNPGVRRRVAESLVRLDARRAIPFLLIAMEANFAGAYLNNALVTLAGEDFGFDPIAPAAWPSTRPSAGTRPTPTPSTDGPGPVAQARPRAGRDHPGAAASGCSFSGA